MEEENIQLQESERRRKRAKKIFVIVIVLLIFIIASGSYGGFRLHKSFLSEESKKVDSIQDVLIERDMEEAIRYQRGIDSVKQLNTVKYDYYNDMLWYKNLAEELQDEIDLIHSLDISHPRLDSLARNIKYPGRKRNN